MILRLLLIIPVVLGRWPAMGQADSLRVRSLVRIAESCLREGTLKKRPLAYLRSETPDRKDLDSACYYLGIASRLSDSLNLDSYRNEILCLLGEAYMKKDQTRKAKRYFLQAIKNAQASGNKEGEANIWLSWAGRADTWKETNYPDIITALEKARPLFGQTHDRDKQIHTLKYIAFFYKNIGKYDLAEQADLEILNMYQAAGSHNLHAAYKELSTVNRYKGDFRRALQYALNAVKNVEDTGDSIGADNAYGELALVYQELGQTDKSIEWYKKTLKIRQQLKQSQLIIYRTTGFLVQQLLKEGRSMEALTTVLQLGRKSPPTGKMEYAALSQITAYCYEALKDYGQAEKYYLEMIKSYQHEKWNDELTAIAYFDIGKFYINRQQFEKGGYYLHKAQDAAPGSNLLSRIRDIHQMLFRVDSAGHRYLSAIHHYQLFKTLNDSIFNDTKSKQIEELQIQYETKAKDKDILLKQRNIQLLTRQGELQAGQLRHANLTRNVTLAGIALSIIITGLLFSRYRLKQKANKALLLQQEEIRSKNRSLESLVAEKEWLLREIHHRVKNNLQIIMSLLNSQSCYLENDAALEAIRNSQQRVQAISLIHQKLYMAENLGTIDMVIYIRELVQYLRDSFSTGRQIIYQFDLDPVELDVSHAVPLGLILTEAITNAIKYAFPGHREGTIGIALKQEDDFTFSLAIADDGIGIPPGWKRTDEGSLGMSLMEGLTEEIGGDFSIGRHNGTTVSVSFMTNTPMQQLPFHQDKPAAV